MGFLMMIAVALGGMIGSIFMGLLKDEASAWLPTMTRLVLTVAVRRLAADQREAYAKEWEADLSEYPGKLGKFFRALGLLKAAGDMQIFSAAEAVRAQRWMGASIIAVTATNWLVDKYTISTNEVISSLPWLNQGLLFLNFAATAAFCWASYWMIRMRATVIKGLDGERQ